MIRAHRILVVCATTILATSCQLRLEATEIPADWKIDNVRQSEPTGGAEVIEIRNLHGDLRVRPVDEEVVSWSAMIQRHADDPRRAEVQTSSEGSALRIEVHYPEIESLDPASQPESWNKRRVDMTLFVPAKRQLIIETARGLIEVKGLDRGVSARSQSGSIVLSTAGPVTAFTERGSITAQFSATDWESAVELETLTGAITAILPPTADTTVTMTTSGELTTDFSLTVERQPGSRSKTARATIGKGDPKLFMTSSRGNLKLLRSLS